MTLEFWYMLPVALVFATVALGSGVEGATFFAPFFILVVGLEPVAAIAAGLVIEVFGFSSGVYAYVRRRLIDYRMGAMLLSASVPAALIGTYAAHFVAPVILKAVLAAGLLVVAASFLRAPSDDHVETIDAANHQPEDRAERCRVTADGTRICYTVFGRTEGVLAGGIGGLFIGMLSTGLGEMNGYLLLQRCRIPARVAIATSVFVVAVTALIASGGHVVSFAQHGNADVARLASLLTFTVPGVLIGGQAGPAVAERIPDRALEIGMGILFILVSLILFAELILV